MRIGIEVELSFLTCTKFGQMLRHGERINQHRTDETSHLLCNLQMRCCSKSTTKRVSLPKKRRQKILHFLFYCIIQLEIFKLRRDYSPVSRQWISSAVPVQFQCSFKPLLPGDWFVLSFKLNSEQLDNQFLVKPSV